MNHSRYSAQCGTAVRFAIALQSRAARARWSRSGPSFQSSKAPWLRHGTMARAPHAPQSVEVAPGDAPPPAAHIQTLGGVERRSDVRPCSVGPGVVVGVPRTGEATKTVG